MSPCRIETIGARCADGVEKEAALIRVEKTAKAGEYVLFNLGIEQQQRQQQGSYVSFCDNGLWVRCKGYPRNKAMTVSLLKPGAPLPPTPPPSPPAPVRVRKARLAENLAY